MASVDEDGLVTAHKVGSATITAVAIDGSKKYRSMRITVMQAPGALSIAGADTVCGGAKLTLQAVSVPASATQKVKWSIDVSKTVATISSSGLVSTKPVTAETQVTVTVVSLADPTVKASKTITISPKSASLSILPQKSVLAYDTTNCTLQLAVQAVPADGYTNVRWSSSNASIATVSSVGLVTARRSGLVIITATDAYGATARKLIRCVKGATSLTVSGADVMVPGGKGKLSAAILPADADVQSVTWSCDHPELATIDPSTGAVRIAKTATTNSTIVFTATHDENEGLTQTHTVTVGVAVNSITLTPETAQTLHVTSASKTLQLEATILPENASDPTVVWSSSDETVATVSDSGLVTGVNGGSATITATASDGAGAEASVAFSVIVDVQSVAISGESSIGGGYPLQLTATVLPENATNKSVTWSIVESGVPATIDQTGLLTTQTVTEKVAMTVKATSAADISLSDTFDVTVYPAAESVTITPETPNMLNLRDADPSATLTASVTPEAASQTIEWTSQNPAIATVDQSGKVTAVAEGDATIVATTKDGTGASAQVVIRVVHSDYSFTETTSGVTLTEYFGDETALVIPAAIGAKPVVALADGLFKDNTAITSAEIPDSVTVIGKELFSGCTALTTVTLSDDVTVIGESAFSGCTKLAEMVCRAAN